MVLWTDIGRDVARCWFEELLALVNLSHTLLLL